MSSTISSLSTVGTSSLTSTMYLLIADAVGVTNYKLSSTGLFTTINTLGTGSESLFVSTTGYTTHNFKGIKSLNTLLTVATASNNITLQVNENLINLANCSNATSNFLSSVSLTSNVTGILPVANGGTGLATLTSNSLYVGNGTSVPTALGVAADGQLVIGRTGLSPVLAYLTAGTNMTVTNAAGAITLAANLSTLTSNLNASTYNIYGTGWHSGDGQNEGMAINSVGKVFIGSSLPTAFYTYDLNVNNSVALNGSTAQYISMGTSSTPGWLIIEGADGVGTNIAGGNVTVVSGDATGTASGGTSYIAGGAAVSSGTAGGVSLNGGNSVTGNAGTININGGASTSSGAGGGIVLSPGTSSSGTGGKTTINATGTAGPLINFGGSTGVASANSVSSSTASAAAKTGAIRVQINGVDAWIRVYATGE